MKKLIIIVAALALLLSACGKQAEQPETSDAPEDAGPRYEYTTETYNQITVGIAVGEEGYYTAWADAELNYMDGSLVNIDILQPTLLAFRASEKWAGGYMVHSVEEINKTIEKLEALRGMVPDEALDEIIETLKNGLEMTEAST